jgi:hypothetical protein
MQQHNRRNVALHLGMRRHSDQIKSSTYSHRTSEKCRRWASVRLTILSLQRPLSVNRDCGVRLLKPGVGEEAPEEARRGAACAHRGLSARRRDSMHINRRDDKSSATARNVSKRTCVLRPVTFLLASKPRGRAPFEPPWRFGCRGSTWGLASHPSRSHVVT